MRYQVMLIPSEEGFAVNCPALPGCWSQGETEPEALTNITDAIRGYLEVRRELELAEFSQAGITPLIREVELAAA